MAKKGQNWLQKWKAVGFSWKNLAKHPPWQPEVGGNLQDYLRRFERGATDDDLKSRGILLDCGAGGLYHILFIPDEWAKSNRRLNCTQDQLREKKAGYWATLFGNSSIPQHFRGHIIGVHLPEPTASQLVAGYRVSFSWTSFQGALNGLPKRPIRTFDNCYFEGEITLTERVDSTQRSTLRFRGCEFANELTFNELEGVHDVSFNSCVISGRLVFEGACGALIRIHGSTLATFDSLGCIFRDDVDLFESDVVGRLSLARCTFEKSFSIVATDLNRAVELLDCDFKGRVTFADVMWPPHSPLNVTAEGSKFHETVSFSGEEIPPTRFFQNAEFKSSVAFPAVRESNLKAAFYAELNAHDQDDDNSNHALAVENGCRTLRKLAEQRGDVHQEHFWHRSEIIARRARGESARAEKLFSYLYGWTADYGLSILRPLSILFLMTCFFAIFYAWLGGAQPTGSGIDWEGVEEGVGYSFSRAIPIGVFADDGNLWRKQLLGSSGEISHLAIRTLATFQSIFSAVMIYLSVMAIRRKFRIS